MLAVQERRTAQLFYKVCLCWMWLSPALQSKMEEKGEAKLFSAVPCSQKNINYAGSERTGQETGRSRLICFFGACSDCCKQTKVVVKLLCVFLNVLQTTKGRCNADKSFVLHLIGHFIESPPPPPGIFPCTSWLPLGVCVLFSILLGCYFCLWCGFSCRMVLLCAYTGQVSSFFLSYLSFCGYGNVFHQLQLFWYCSGHLVMRLSPSLHRVSTRVSIWRLG